jgi:hypothetical protein
MMELPILFAMEYIPNSIKLDKVNGHELSAHSNWGKCVLKELGQLLAFDVLINNWDRFPFLWRKDAGNSGNFLFTKVAVRGFHVFGIDQRVTSIVATGPGEKNFTEYFEKIDSLMKELSCVQEISDDQRHSTDFSVEKSQTPVLFSILEYLQENSPEYNPTKLDFITVVVGVLKGIESCVSKISREKLTEIYAEYDTEVSALLERMVAGQDVNGKYGLHLVDVEFLGKILDTYKKHMDLVGQKLVLLKKFT